MAARTVAPECVIAGRYRLGDEIGRGGMAVVYCAHDLQLRRDVALKLFNPEAADERFATGSIAEARTAASIFHPNIVTVFDAGEQDGRPFIVMEYVEGGDLADLLRSEGRLDPAEVARIGHGVARGLAALHARGLVHCDIKPQNVLLTRARLPKLVDFGIARLASTTGTLGSDEIYGSVPYLSPEQVAGERIDPRTDVYALGTVLYELLTGRTPFGGGTLAEVALQRLHLDPRPVCDLAPDVPPALEATVERALARDPARRFADAAELATALAGQSGRVAADGGRVGEMESGRRIQPTVVRPVRPKTAAADQSGAPAAPPAQRRVASTTVRVAAATAIDGVGATLRQLLSHAPTLPIAHSSPRLSHSPALLLLVGFASLLLLGLGGLRLAAFNGADEQAVAALAEPPTQAASADPSAVAAPPLAVAQQAPTAPPTAAPTAAPSVSVPPVAAIPFDQAAQRLRQVRLEPLADEQLTTDTPRGLVVTQDPPAGQNVQPGAQVRLLVSRGIELPSFIGQQWDDVKPWMDANGWQLGGLRFVVADADDWGKVVWQDPPVETAPVDDKGGTPISLHVAGPPEATRTGFPPGFGVAAPAEAAPAPAVRRPMAPPAPPAPAPPPAPEPAPAPAPAPPPPPPAQVRPQQPVTVPAPPIRPPAPAPAPPPVRVAPAPPPPPRPAESSVKPAKDDKEKDKEKDNRSNGRG